MINNTDDLELKISRPLLPLKALTLLGLICSFTLVGFEKASAQQVELQTQAQVNALLSRYAGHVDFAGHGSKGQIADRALPKLNQDLDDLVVHMNKEYGAGNWIAMFGGDSYNPEKPDIAYALKYLQDKHGIPLFAAQSDVVKGWGGVDKHINYVYYVPTGYEPKLDESGKPVIENGVVKQQVIWGGFRNGKGVGPTGFYFPEGQQIITDFVAIGGGPVTVQEYDYAGKVSIPRVYIKTEARFPEVNGPYGSLETFLNEQICSELFNI